MTPCFQRNRGGVIACLLIAVVASAALIAGIVIITQTIIDNAAQQAFDETTGNFSVKLNAALNRSLLQVDVLSSVTSQYDVNNRTFNNFLAAVPTLSSIAAANAIIWAPFVPQANVLAHEIAMRAEVSSAAAVLAVWRAWLALACFDLTVVSRVSPTIAFLTRS